VNLDLNVSLEKLKKLKSASKFRMACVTKSYRRSCGKMIFRYKISSDAAISMINSRKPGRSLVQILVIRITLMQCRADEVVAVVAVVVGAIVVEDVAKERRSSTSSRGRTTTNLREEEDEVGT
jgi:hypothetical protein